MFISSYETSRKPCCFSEEENSARLQECLKGEALEAVKSRLLLPERLLNMLLSKVHNAAPPKADRLLSFTSFGVIVQQLADHLEVIT